MGSVGALQALGPRESGSLWCLGSVGWFPFGVNITGGIVFPVMLLGLSLPRQHRPCVPQRGAWNKIDTVFSKLPPLEQAPVHLAPSQRKRICLDNVSQPDHQECCSFCPALSPQEGSPAFFPLPSSVVLPAFLPLKSRDAHPVSASMVIPALRLLCRGDAWGRPEQHERSLPEPRG